MSARLCRCGHAEHSYFCLVSGCKCEHFEQARCECSDPECGGERHSAGERCLNNAHTISTVEVPAPPEPGVERAYEAYVDEKRLLCLPCHRHNVRVTSERIRSARRSAIKAELGQLGREYGETR